MTLEYRGSAHLRYLYWRFIVLGLASLMAWNIYIVSSDFFRYEFRNTPFHDNFESIFSVASNSVNLAALCFALYTQPKADHDHRISRGLLATVVSFIAVFMLPVLGISGWTALVVALTALCVCSVAAAYIQCSVFGIAALLPACCAEGYMSGQAIAGTIASAIQLASVYLSQEPRHDNGSFVQRTREDDERDEGRLRTRSAAYFGVSAVFMVVSMFAWTQLNKNLGAHMSDGHGYEALPSTAAADGGEGTVEGEIEGRDSVFASASLPSQQFGIMREGSPRQTRDLQSASAFEQNESGVTAAASASAEATATATEMNDLETISGSVETSADPEPKLPAWISTLGLDNAQQLYRAYRETFPYICACAIVMGQTLAVFPPLTEAVVSSPKSTPRVAHLTAWHFLLFNIGDYLGRLCTKWVKCSSHRILHAVNGMRTLLIPVLLMFPTLATPAQRTLLIHSDLLFLVLVLVLGWTNGWVATIALIAGPRRATNKGLAGSVLGFAMCIGLVVGAVASYPILLLAGIS
ncbi:hypothetical protein LPJ53_000340 [Coemansia erecta]|uniref:Uncharacterized protein n=1 Tax=Coemansia erecta TaxID=147472 RepID=A0A9W7Y6D7_9FUNG|nr:hypothetical protein LPJ53_000340 [Coemansia erecta]